MTNKNKKMEAISNLILMTLICAFVFAGLVAATFVVAGVVIGAIVTAFCSFCLGCMFATELATGLI